MGGWVGARPNDIEWVPPFHGNGITCRKADASYHTVVLFLCGTNFEWERFRQFL